MDRWMDMCIYINTHIYINNNKGGIKRDKNRCMEFTNNDASIVIIWVQIKSYKISRPKTML